MLTIVEENMSQKLFQAIHDNDRAKVERLIAADPALASAHGESGVSALMQARYEGRREIVDLLRPAVGALDVFEAATLGDRSRAGPGLQQRRLYRAAPGGVLCPA